MMFACERVCEISDSMGIWGRLQDLLTIDQSGSVIMEEVLRIGGQVNDLNNVGFAELVLTGGWYIWWQRQQVVHGEAVQSPSWSAVAIVALTVNFLKAANKKVLMRNGWQRPAEGKFMLMWIQALT